MKSHPAHSPCPPINPDLAPGFCRKLVSALAALKEQLRQKYENVLPGRPGLVREIIAEAEALAWETPFPHLFLPDFAELRLAKVMATLQPAFVRAA